MSETCQCPKHPGHSLGSLPVTYDGICDPCRFYCLHDLTLQTKPA